MHSITLVGSDLLTSAILGGVLWFICILVIRFHHRGMELVGSVLASGGFLFLFMLPTTIVPYLLLMSGMLVHGTGRSLQRLHQAATNQD